MRTFFFLFLFIVIFNQYASGETSTSILEFNFPKHWKVEFNGDYRQPMYKVKHADNENVELLIYRSICLDMKKENISALMENLIQDVLDDIRNTSENSELLIEKERREISGIDFSGESVFLGIRIGAANSQSYLYMTVFMLSDNQDLWGGNFVGPKELWEEVVVILEKMKHKRVMVQ